MKTTIFEWAERQGYTLQDLAKMTGYTDRQLRRIKNGYLPVSEAFAGRVILRMGEWARSLFLYSVSDKSDISSQSSEATA